MPADVNRLPDGDRPPSTEPHATSAQQSAKPHLTAAIKKTIESAALDDGAETRDPALGVMISFARRHSAAISMDDPQITAKLVYELGKCALPAPALHPAIERASPEIAAVLLADPTAADHLAKAWASARRAAGITPA